MLDVKTCLACGNNTVNSNNICAVCSRDNREIAISRVRSALDNARGQMNIASIWLAAIEAQEGSSNDK